MKYLPLAGINESRSVNNILFKKTHRDEITSVKITDITAH